MNTNICTGYTSIFTASYDELNKHLTQCGLECFETRRSFRQDDQLSFEVNCFIRDSEKVTMDNLFVTAASLGLTVTYFDYREAWGDVPRVFSFVLRVPSSQGGGAFGG